MNKFILFAALFGIATAELKGTNNAGKECKTFVAQIVEAKRTQCTDLKSCEKCAADQANKDASEPIKGITALLCSQAATCLKEDAIRNDNPACKDLKADKCIDQVAYCPAWVARDGCDLNPTWMHTYCQKSCCAVCTQADANTNDNSLCPDEANRARCTRNVDRNCEKWATDKPQDATSECQKNPKWMIPRCALSCCSACFYDNYKCPTTRMQCGNKHGNNDQCITWARAGQCQVNPRWMNENCAMECCPLCRQSAPAPVGALGLGGNFGGFNNYAYNTGFGGGYGGYGLPVYRG